MTRDSFTAPSKCPHRLWGQPSLLLEFERLKVSGAVPPFSLYLHGVQRGKFLTSLVLPFLATPCHTFQFITYFFFLSSSSTFGPMQLPQFCASAYSHCVMFSSPNIIRAIKSRRIWLAWHVARVGYKLLVGKPEGKWALERSWVRSNNSNVKMILMRYVGTA
jgi:hypothetical protein